MGSLYKNPTGTEEFNFHNKRVLKLKLLLFKNPGKIENQSNLVYIQDVSGMFLNRCS